MKNTIYFTVLALFLTLFACENNDYLIYNANQTNRFFFEKDSTKFLYGLTMDKNPDISLRVTQIGLVDQTKDITYKVVVNKELSSAVVGVHYNLPETLVFKKDSIHSSIPIDFIKTNLEINKDYTLTLDLVENENYKPTDRTRCVVVFGNKDIPAPVWWQSNKVGAYQQEKFILFVDLFTKTKEVSPVIYNKIAKTWGANLDQGTATNLLTIYAYQSYLKKYILIPMYNYYLETNNPIYEIPNPNN